MHITNRSLRVFLFSGAAFLGGCGILSLPDGAPAVSNFLGLVVSDFSGTQAIAVQNDSVMFESSTATLPQDLLIDLPDDGSFVLSGPAVRVSVGGDGVLFNSAAEPVENHVRITFRLGPPGSDPCQSGTEVGPFDLVVLDGEVMVTSVSVPLPAEAQEVVLSGQLEICAEVDADFDGSVSVGKVKLEFGELGPNESKVELCHIPPGDSEARHTITVGESAVDAHLDHGDTLGPCDEGNQSSDGDGDGVVDEVDLCANTPAGETVDGSGCSCSQTDADGDSVNDCDDVCPDTPNSVEVDGSGCPLDGDGDGVADSADACADTPSGETVGSDGCSCSQLDGDADGVNDCDDFCPGTPTGVVVDQFGCELVGANAGSDTAVAEVGCVTLEGSANGGTPPYIYSWSAPGWEGSMEQSPSVVPAETTTYTLTVTDSSFPPVTTSDSVTITISPREDLQYTIVDLGSLSTNGSFPAALNGAGDVVGFYFNDSLEKRAFLYSGAVMTDLGTLGGAESTATDVNDAGQVVGQSTTSAGARHAFLWDSVGGMIDLGAFDGGTSIANAINKSGEVVGSSDTGSTTQAFLSGGSVISDVGTLDSFFSELYDINDAGQAVGTILSGGSSPQAFVHQGGVLTQLELSLLSASRAWAINNSEMIAGHSWGAGEYVSFLHVCDVTIDLGILAGFDKTSVWGINDPGQMVGSVSSDASALFNAFIYTAGQLRNLNDLLADGGDWEYLTVAFDVNSAGQITGYGRIAGQFRGFLLTPVP